MHRVVIVGGGFGGVTAVKALKKSGLQNLCITLISDKSWLEYYGVLYRLIRGASPAEACLPLRLMMDQSVHRIVDEVQTIDPVRKTVTGKTSSYGYDTLILAPGSVPSFFGIAGMQENAMTMKSAADALAIRQHVINQITLMAKEKNDLKRHRGKFIVIGGGPTGIEVAGEVLPLAHRTAKTLGIDPSMISVNVLEAADRLLPMIEETASRKTKARLEKNGVCVRLQCAVASADASGVVLANGEKLDAGTIIWTAGVKAHPLLAAIPGLTLDKRGRAVVDETLRPAMYPDVYVIGDCAATPYSGMAQTAVEDGHFVAKVIAATLKKKPLPTYKPKKPAYAIPAGTRWAAVKFGPLRVYGLPGSLMRRAADIHVYMLVIPWRYIPAAFFGRNLEKSGRM